MFSSWIIKSVIQRRLFVFQWNKIESDRESNFVRFKFLKRIAVSNVLPITVRECARLCRNATTLRAKKRNISIFSKYIFHYERSSIVAASEKRNPKIWERGWIIIENRFEYSEENTENIGFKSDVDVERWAGWWYGSRFDWKIKFHSTLFYVFTTRLEHESALRIYSNPVIRSIPYIYERRYVY